MGYLDVGPGWVAMMCALYYVNPAGCFLPFCAAEVVHELGHILALRILGVPIHRLRLNLSGAVLDTGSMDYRREVVCALAGPAANLLLVPLGRWMPMFSVLCLCLAVFNLLPIVPLDGGRALQAALLMHFPQERSDRMIGRISAMVGVLVAGVAFWLSVGLHGGLWPILVAALTLLRLGWSMAGERKIPL